MKILKGYSDYPKSGIYCLLNLYNNKFYIGSSVNLSKRVWEHFYSLDKGEHHNNYLQRSFNKYKSYFVGFVLEDVEKDSLIEREQYWMDTLDASNPEIGYNILPTAFSFYGYKHTDEQRQRMSELKSGENHPNYGKQLPEETKKRIGKGNKGKVRSDETKEKLRDINLGKTHSEQTKKKISKSLKSKEWTAEQLDKMGNANSKQVFQYDLNGNLINIFKSVAEAARQLGFKRENIYRVCRGERNKYKNFIWKYDYVSL